jgi:hypothetical protein
MSQTSYISHGQIKTCFAKKLGINTHIFVEHPTSPNSFIVGGDGGFIATFDVSSGEITVHKVVFSENKVDILSIDCWLNGKQIAVGVANSGPYIFDFDWKLISHVANSRNPKITSSQHVMFMPDGRLILGSEEYIYVVERIEQQKKRWWQSRPPPVCLEISLIGKYHHSLRISGFAVVDENRIVSIARNFSYNYGNFDADWNSLATVIVWDIQKRTPSCFLGVRSPDYGLKYDDEYIVSYVDPYWLYTRDFDVTEPDCVACVGNKILVCSNNPFSGACDLLCWKVPMAMKCDNAICSPDVCYEEHYSKIRNRSIYDGEAGKPVALAAG